MAKPRLKQKKGVDFIDLRILDLLASKPCRTVELAALIPERGLRSLRYRLQLLAQRGLVQQGCLSLLADQKYKYNRLTELGRTLAGRKP